MQHFFEQGVRNPSFLSYPHIVLLYLLCILYIIHYKIFFLYLRIIVAFLFISRYLGKCSLSGYPEVLGGQEWPVPQSRPEEES